MKNYHSTVLALCLLVTLSACTGSEVPPVEPAAGKNESTARAAETPTANTSSTPVGENTTVTTPSAPSDVAAPPVDATTTTSGLAYKVLREGTGSDHPTITSKVEVHYSGWTTDGKLFDSSVVRGETISFPLNGVIKGWSEGVQLMVVGEKTRFWIPAELAYGETPRRPGAPAGRLVFDIELFNIKEPPAPPSVPENIAGPPDDATVTASGLAYKVLREGTGTAHPMATPIRASTANLVPISP